MVLHGETECGIGRQRFSVPQHCFSVINPDVDHYNVTRCWKHAAFVIFPRQIVDETAWQMYRLLSRPVAFSDVVAPCSTDLTAVMHVLFHEAAHPDRPGWLLLVDSALIQLSVVLLRSLSGNHTARAAATFNTRAAQEQVARAVDLIHSNFQDDLSLDDLARLELHLANRRSAVEPRAFVEESIVILEALRERGRIVRIGPDHRIHLVRRTRRLRRCVRARYRRRGYRAGRYRRTGRRTCG